MGRAYVGNGLLVIPLPVSMSPGEAKSPTGTTVFFISVVICFPLVCCEAHQGFSIILPLLYSILPDNSTKITDVQYFGAIAVLVLITD